MRCSFQYEDSIFPFCKRHRITGFSDSNHIDFLE